MLVQKRTLLLLAGVVWLFAGYNIARIGWISYENMRTIQNLTISVLIFLCFWFLIFSKLVKKHTKRILSYETKQVAWHFFDQKSFWLMAGMITLVSS